MKQLDKEFFENFIELEKLCNGMFDCQSGVSEYISQMEGYGDEDKAKISTWDADYKMLKHFRWLRNTIAHEGEADCTSEDMEKLSEFINRISNKKDPISAVAKAKKAKSKSGKTDDNKDEYPPTSGKTSFLLFLGIVAYIFFIILVTSN